jgi:hypothetical protein
MRRFATLLVLALTFVVSASALAEQITPPPAPTVVNTYRLDFNGSFTPWLVQVVDNKYVWDILMSTDGWAEVDAGLNVAVGPWTFQPIIGSDVCRDPELGAHVYSFLPQLYLLRYGALHAETWAVGVLPYRSADPDMFRLRQIVSHQLGQTRLWVGVHGDLELYKHQSPAGWLGPIVEHEVVPGAMASVTYAPGQQSRFLFTVVMTK